MRTHCYRITIAGGLGEIGREAFSDFRIESNGTNTVLIGNPVTGRLNRDQLDQAREIITAAIDGS